MTYTKLQNTEKIDKQKNNIKEYQFQEMEEEKKNKNKNNIKQLNQNFREKIQLIRFTFIVHSADS